MKTPMIAACGTRGCVFEGAVEHTYCFVPEALIVTGDAGLRIAEGDYVRGGWDVRNMRSNETTNGQRLFPNSHRPVADLSSPAVRNFLGRIEQLTHN